MVAASLAILAWATTSWVVMGDNHLDSFLVTASLAVLALALVAASLAAAVDTRPFEAVASSEVAVVGNHPFAIVDIHPLEVAAS